MACDEMDSEAARTAKTRLGLPSGLVESRAETGLLTNVSPSSALRIPLRAGDSAKAAARWHLTSFPRMRGVEIRSARDDERAAALELRRRVFCEEQGVPEREELDGRDADGLHLVAVDGEGAVLATCRLLFAGSTVQFSRLAVERAARRRGLASALLAAAERETRAAGARRMVLHAQTYALDLYSAHGWQTRGKKFVEAGIEHIAMEKSVA
jgi:predicted GNAT family N-acyltransferase